MSAIQAQGLRKAFGSFVALNGLSLSVEPGAVFGFLGPNGAGKTTTIRILAGLARADAGEVCVAGVDLRADGHLLCRRVGYLPEEPAFYPWMSAVEFLDYVGRLYGHTTVERQKRSAELLELTGLTEARKRRVGGYSRGMRQRLGLAQALYHRPEVLLLDEPVSALDPAGRKGVLELIEGLRGQCTVFMSTHILADVERICDSVAVIDHGQLLVEGRRDELIDRYAAPALRVEAAARSVEAFTAWIANLKTLAWVSAVSLDGPAATVQVLDLPLAQRELLRLAVAADLTLERYELVKPTLEDVFLRIVA
ncbi:MAG TPA: ABC transporter ATP-binding protein [Anaerolineaceae bacterium]|nr:ABC transporter ATP-binding protein [Anaerolineaceae bacterium]